MDRLESSSPSHGTSNLTPKERLGIIRKDLGLRLKTLDGAMFRRPGDPRWHKVFGTKKPDSIRKLFSPMKTGDSVPWRAEYAEPIILWLRQAYGWDAPTDLFTAYAETPEEFRALCSRKRGKHRQRYASAEQNALATILDQIEVAKDDASYFARTPSRPFGLAGKDARALREIIVEGGVLPPPPELTRLANTHSVCTGCGRGADEHRLFADAIDAVWQRFDEVLSSLADEDENLGLAEVIARGAQGRSLAGDLGGSRERSDAVESLYHSGFLGPERPQLISVRARIRESRTIGGEGDAPDELAFLEGAAAAFGRLSNEYLSELRCRACRAVQADSPTAEARIDEARVAMSKAAERYPDRREALANDEKDLDFIVLTRLERRYGHDAGEFDAALTTSVGAPFLQALLAKTKAPLRQAKLCYWIWRATGRSHPGLLRRALGLVAQRPTVRHLCVLNVPAFENELRRCLSRG